MKNNDIGTIWYDCMLVRNFKEELNFYKNTETTKKILNELNEYKRQNPNFANDNGSIWYDLKNNFCFGSEQYKSWPGTKNIPSKDHSYFCSSDRFSTWGKDFVKLALKCNKEFSKEPVMSNEDFFIGYPSSLKKFKGKSVLILGGGPSANSVNWDNLDVDYLWSINKFYLNEKVANKKVDLATVAGHIDLMKEKELHDYIKSNDTIISFELERGNINAEYHKYEELAEFANLFKDQTTFFHTRYKSQPGVGMRLICYAIFLGCKDIYFVGVDGFTERGPLHSFEREKENPNWYNKYGNEIQIRQYIVFWDYLLKLKDKFDYNIYNLGENHKYNVSGEISKIVSPLPDHIREKIK